MCLASLLVGFLASQDIGAQEKEKGKQPGDEKDAPPRVSIGSGDIPTRDFLGLFADMNGLPVLIEAADSPRLSETITIVAPIRNASETLLREILRANGWFVRRDVLPDGKAVLRVSKTGRALPDIDTTAQRIIITSAGKSPKILEARFRRLPKGTRRLRIFELRHREVESFSRLLSSIFSTEAEAGKKDEEIDTLSLRGPIKIITDRPTRQVVVETWYDEDLKVVEAIIQKLDRPETNPLVTRVYQARHQKAALLVEALRPIYAPSQSDVDRAASPEQGASKPLIVAHEKANSLLIQLARDRHDEVLRVLKILDDPRISLAGFQTPKPAKKPAPTSDS